jgi:hypothetical protein
LIRDCNWKKYEMRAGAMQPGIMMAEALVKPKRSPKTLMINQPKKATDQRAAVGM